VCHTVWQQHSPCQPDSRHLYLLSVLSKQHFMQSCHDLTLKSFLLQILFIKTWAAIFAVVLSSVNITHFNSVTNDLYNPLIIWVLYEQLKKKQIQWENAHAPQELQQKNMKSVIASVKHDLYQCDTCDKSGHNVITC